MGRPQHGDARRCAMWGHGVMTARPQEDGNVVAFLKEDDGPSPLDRPKSMVGSADDDGPS